MIKGLHAMFYSEDADALRVFVRDKLQLPYTDTGGGWLIFQFPEAELGCHSIAVGNGEVADGTHMISFYCDDINSTVAELKGRGVEFSDEISEREYGHVTHFKMPGNIEVELYQPRYSMNPLPG